jgi:hypothetical protein
MKNKKTFFSPHLVRITGILIAFSILLSSTSAGQNTDFLREGVSNPAEIPLFENFKTPGIVPGNSGTLKFTITNRYEFAVNNTMINVNNTIYNVTKTMYNVTLVLNIYRYVTLEKSKNVTKISNGPRIVSGNEGLSEIIDQYTAVFFWPMLTWNQTLPVELKIKSSSDSPQGTYFVRMHLKFKFKFNVTYFKMKSRGHFNDTKWDSAQPEPTDPDKYPIVGRLDLNVLKVDGIIPETSFRIKEPIPLWPFYVGVGLAVLFLVLAGVFYLMDEKGKFPNAKRKLDNLGEKVSNFRYRRK